MAQLVHDYFKNRPDAALMFVPVGTGNEIAEVPTIIIIVSEDLMPPDQ